MSSKIFIPNDKMNHRSFLTNIAAISTFNWLPASLHIQSNRQDASYCVSARQKISLKEVKTSFSGVILPSLEADKTYLAPPDRRLLTVAKDISTLLVQNDLLKEEDSLINLIDSSYLPRTVGEF